MARQKKNPFEDLDQEWKAKADSSSSEELKAEVVKVSNNESVNQKNKADDQHLAEKKEEYDTAGIQYKEATAANKLKIKYSLDLLRAKGAL